MGDECHSAKDRDRRQSSSLGGHVGSSSRRRSAPNDSLATSSKRGRLTRQHDIPSFGFKKLYKFLTTSANDVLLSINKNKDEWKSVLESEDLIGRKLIVVLEVIADKICVDTPVLSQLQTNALISCCSSKFTEKLVKVVEEIMYGIPVPLGENRDLKNEFPVDTSPTKIMKNIYDLCNFLMTTMPNNGIDYFRGIIEKSILASKIDSDLKTKFEELFEQVREEIEKRTKLKEEEQQMLQPGSSAENSARYDDMTPPDNIQEIAVIPTVDELLLTNKTFLRPNKVSGAYNDSEHYLDVQFRLFREDFVQPLRKGIQAFLRDVQGYVTRDKKMPAGEIRLYTNVRIVNAVKERGTVVYKLQLSKEGFRYKSVNWHKSKRFLTGSLIILTKVDNSFQHGNTYFGTVFSREAKELEKGIVTALWEGSPPKLDEHEKYLLFESEVYLEAYRHTLETLKNLKLENFPMKKFIVDSSNMVDAPRYLKASEEYIYLRLKFEDDLLSPYRYDALSAWPTADDLGLDENQLLAFRAALTKEFSIIQGPPGTGKTFLGLKIATTLLDNSKLWEDDVGNPITVVCYTNHALDQFMEGIIRYYSQIGEEPQIVRIGGRCKSEGNLKNYTLREVRRRKGWKLGKEYDTSESFAKKEIGNLEWRRSEELVELALLQSSEGVIDFEKLRMWGDGKLQAQFPEAIWEYLRNHFWLGLDDYRLSCESINERDLAKKMFPVKAKERMEQMEIKPTHCKQSITLDDKDVKPDEFYDIDDLMEGRVLDDLEDEFLLQEVESMKGSCRSNLYLPECSTKDCDNMIQDIKKVVQMVTQNLSKFHADMVAEQYDEKLRALQVRQKLLGDIFRYYKEKRLELPNMNQLTETIRDPNFSAYDNLSWRESWGLYFAVLETAKKLTLEYVAELDRKLQHARNALKGIIQHGDGVIIKSCKVVGLTTTGAAKYNSLLREIKSKIVIVEEAAEVFEAHIVTCITQNCEQLILIGDHLQLRPNPNVYALTKDYNLNISLFERMVHNKLHCYQLKLQHRMRPEISNLVKGTIYKELYDDEKVKRYPSVRGITKNVFFITHTEKEKSETDSTSKSNEHEAEFMVALCRHLILQGYKPDKITVLTMYTGQMFLLKKKIEDISKTCPKIRITCVDNFQGEENDIILLSLVRSNSEGKIGFVGIENRICVALSRAKHGLYIIGNMEMIESQSAKWKEIKQKLEENKQIGPALELECQVHGTKSNVHSGPEFQLMSPEGGCKVICNKNLSCSHKCRRVCHVQDKNHSQHVCREKCVKKCANELHHCKKFCFEPCPPCYEPIERTLFCEYNHKKEIPCCQKLEDVICLERVEKTLPCEHKAVMSCGTKEEEFPCKIEVTKLLPCCHEKTMECRIDRILVNCKIIVPKSLPCGHTQNGPCWKPSDLIKCVTLVAKKFSSCEHEVNVKCSEKDKAICKAKCSTRLDCGHQCINLCHAENDPDHILYKCTKSCCKECESKHRCKANHSCHKPCPPCKEKVERVLSCGHKLKLECSVPVETYQCIEKCQRTLSCNHACPNLCFQACGSCEVLVTKTAECGHEQSIACGKPALKENCEVLVTPKTIPSCGHQDVKVPCKYDGASEVQLLKYCQKPCDYKFEDLSGENSCNHSCAGTCYQCFQGRIHIKCKAKCGKQLVCGHSCDVPCSTVCPPCQKPCLMKCEHSKCKKKCGEPCTECKEPCTWKCPHAKCTKLCGELCNRKPCNKSCPKKLKCGHICVGFCGEPCPPLCRICDKNELTEDFVLLGTEDEKDARFVYLMDCKHTIEVEGLEKSLMIAESAEVKTKVCPRCTTPIRNCRRFNNIIRKCNEDVIAIKKLSLGDKENTKRMQKLWIARLSATSPLQEILPSIHAKIKASLIREIRGRDGGMMVSPRMMDEFSMKSIDFIADAAKKAAEELASLKDTEDLTEPQYGKVLELYSKTLTCMLDRHPLSRQEVMDFNVELDRIDYFKQLMIRRSMSLCSPGNEKAYSAYILAKKFVASSVPLTKQRKETFLRLLQELDEILKCGLGITNRERNEIVRAMGMSQGHWFKCPNGHIYAIGECGGAMTESKCNECGASIGGGRHQLRVDNELATEMDGATNAAWPTALRR